MSQSVTTFEDLYEKHAKDVYRFAYWLCGDEDDAKDITSETFVRVWTSDTETRLETVKAYLFAIARNQFLHMQRKKKRFTKITEENAGSTQETERDTEAQSELDRTMQALDALPEIDRTILILRAQDELTYDEIATITGLSLSTVKIRLFRARVKLTTIRNKNERNTP